MSERPDPQRIIAQLLGPAAPEIGCDECFDELDRFVELERAGAAADAAIPGMRPHLAGCPPAARSTRAWLRYWPTTRPARPPEAPWARVSASAPTTTCWRPWPRRPRRPAAGRRPRSPRGSPAR